MTNASKKVINGMNELNEWHKVSKPKDQTKKQREVGHEGVMNKRTFSLYLYKGLRRTIRQTDKQGDKCNVADRQRDKRKDWQENRETVEPDNKTDWNNIFR